MHGQQNDKYTEMHGQQNHKYTEMHGQQNDKYTEMHGQQNHKYTEMHGQQNVTTYKCICWYISNHKLNTTLTEPDTDSVQHSSFQTPTNFRIGSIAAPLQANSLYLLIHLLTFDTNI